MKKNSFNIVLFISVLLISIFGLVMIYSASYVWAEYKFNNPYKFVMNQGIFFIVEKVYLILFTYLFNSFHVFFL